MDSDPAVNAESEKVVLVSPTGNLTYPFLGSGLIKVTKLPQAPDPFIPVHPVGAGGVSPAYSYQQKTACISAIVQPILSGVESAIFRVHGFIFGCNEKRTFDTCGKIRAKISCSSDESHRPYFKHERCNDPLCPVCYPKFTSRLADGIVRRVMGYMSVFPSEKVFHLIFWPDSLTGYSNLKEAFADAGHLVKKMNLKMSSVVYHPYRIKPELKPKMRRYRNKHGISPDIGFWQLAHDDVLGLGGLGAYVIPGAHFHAIAAGYLPNIVEYVKLGIGGYKKGRYLTNEVDLHRLAYYLTTHACREAGKSTVRYLGDISYSKLARDDGTTTIKDAVCDVCGASLHEHACDDNGTVGSLLHSHVTRKTVIFKYWVRGTSPPGSPSTKFLSTSQHKAELRAILDAARAVHNRQLPGWGIT